MDEYTKQAKDFCQETGTIIEINFSHYGKHFIDDKEKRDIYNITIKRNNKSYSFKYGDSINNTEKNEKRRTRIKPTEYDILACLIKYDIDCNDEWEFAKEYGYNIDTKQDYIKVVTTFEAVKDEYKNTNMLFNDVMEELQEIQ
jgi:hypothetical protein